MDCEITKAVDGFYHPETEDQIICLVQKAHTEGLQLRCRGAAHSVAWSIYTDPGQGDAPIPNKVSEESSPKGPNINIMLDKLTRLEWVDAERGIVEAEAGIHLGRDPLDPTKTSTLENSLLYQIFQKGWALNDLGGITHQTVSGFLTTGSAGGSLTYDLSSNILALRVVDGLGEVQWIEKSDDIFGAMSLSLGLLGIITKVRLQLTKAFNIYGQQFTTPTAVDTCPIDLFGPGTETKPSMVRFLEQTPYTRILWWPQKKVDRVVVWEAVRGPVLPAFDPVPYEEFALNVGGQLEQLFGATFFTILGNAGFFATWAKLRRGFKQFKKNIQLMLQKKLGAFLSTLLASLITGVCKVMLFVPVVFFSLFKGILLWLYPFIVGLFQPLTAPGKAELFLDYYWRSLPMDNTADDILMGTEFTELWFPLRYTQQVMAILRRHFDANGFAATDFFATELYAGFKSESWLSPGFADGEYSEGTFRVDIFWYINNVGEPEKEGGFYQQFWELFRAENIPFRLHWGKFIPGYDFHEWAAYYRSQWPRWNDFLALRTQRDPHNIFLTDYWQERLQIQV